MSVNKARSPASGPSAARGPERPGIALMPAPTSSGADRPGRGVGAGLVMPCADTQAMNAHLAEISVAVAPGAHAVLIPDGAGWHASATFKVGSIFTIRLSASQIFTRSASKMTMGYVRSSARVCHSRTSLSTASVTRLIRSGETLIS